MSIQSRANVIGLQLSVAADALKLGKVTSWLLNAGKRKAPICSLVLACDMDFHDTDINIQYLQVVINLLNFIKHSKYAPFLIFIHSPHLIPFHFISLVAKIKLLVPSSYTEHFAFHIPEL